MGLQQTVQPAAGKHLHAQSLGRRLLASGLQQVQERQDLRGHTFIEVLETPLPVGLSAAMIAQVGVHVRAFQAQFELLSFLLQCPFQVLQMHLGTGHRNVGAAGSVGNRPFGRGWRDPGIGHQELHPELAGAQLVASCSEPHLPCRVVGDGTLDHRFPGTPEEPESDLAVPQPDALRPSQIALDRAVCTMEL